MYISKLKLQGFKSFLNKTDLNFGEGVTAVVGPNGCGKSNIVDAIRWVLGEQKISILRSNKMEDVIFNGTKSRKPLSFCEASLLIHNSREILPIEYNDVEISRRLYRSGESEFYINKNLCRLKDIQNLFVDTGMSSNAYSVIELKMVDSILSHNANDRRKMFEEAAGINNYKQQRQAALRKITATRVDMERVNDIIVEVNNSIKNLRLQVKRFERFDTLNKDLKKLNIEVAQVEIQHLAIKLAPLQDKLNQIKGKQSNLSGQMNLDETLTEQVQTHFEDKKAKLNKCQLEISNLENTLSALNSNLLVWSEKILGNENQKNHFTDELQNNEDSLNISIKKLEELNSKKENLLPEIKKRKIEFNKHERQYNKVKDNYENILRHQENFKKQTESEYLKIREEEGVLERLKNTISELYQTKEIHSEKIAENYQKIDNCKADSNLARANVESQEKKIKNITNELESQKTKQSLLEDDILSLKEKKNILLSNISTLNSQKEFYANVIENHEGRPSGIKHILNDREKYPFVLGVLSDIIEVDDPYQLAVETALGEYGNFLVVDSEENAQLLITETNKRLSIFVLEHLPEIKPIKLKSPVELLLSKINCDPKLQKLITLLLCDVGIIPTDKTNSHFINSNPLNWVDASGNYFYRGYIIKSPGKEPESVIGRKQKLEQLQNDTLSAENSLNKLKKKLENTVKNANDIHNVLHAKSSELDFAIQKLNDFEQKLQQQDYISIQYQESISELKENQKKTDSQITDYNIQLKTVKDSIHNARIEHEKSSKEYESFQAKIAEDRFIRRTQQQNVQDSRIKLLEIKKEKEGLDYRIETFTSQEKEIRQRIKKYNSEMSRINIENKKLQSSLVEGKEKVLELSNNLELGSREKDELEQAYNKAYDELQRLQSGIRERQKQKDELLNTIREYEITIAEANNEIKHHRSRIKERFNEELSDDNINLKEYDLSSRKVEIENIQRSLDRIGPVNLAVAEEYERESERYTFLLEQSSDLEESEKIINETIEKLNCEAETKFMDTFTAIQENFTKTYSSFFNGGQGHLRLVGEDKPLEAEIEIIAQPPGKKTQTLRMLSAGEKALTAIALLFAIYLVKPSPFCILDEVDAPLDDANIRKFTQVLREFSNKTQFIVVTHNKLTMEKADFIYGVTQVEEGISKIVSVKFGNEKIEAFA